MEDEQVMQYWQKQSSTMWWRLIKMFELTMSANHSVNFVRLSERMQITLLSADFPDKVLYRLCITL